MAKRWRVGFPSQFVPDSHANYHGAPHLIFLQAIELEAPEVVEDFRDAVFMPLMRELSPPEPAEDDGECFILPSGQRMKIGGRERLPFEEDTPPSRLVKMPELEKPLSEWKERWNLASWSAARDREGSRHFNELLMSVLEQWECAYFQPLPDKPLAGRTGLRPAPDYLPSPWIPKSEELPWSKGERTLMEGRHRSRWYVNLEVRNDVNKRAMLAGSWMPPLHLVSEENLDEFKADESVMAQMLPPPFFPVFDPSSVTYEGPGITWDSAVKQIGDLYKKRVMDAYEEAGRTKEKPRPVKLEHFRWLVRYQVKQESYYAITNDSETESNDSSNLRKQVRRAASRIGLKVRKSDTTAQNQSG